MPTSLVTSPRKALGDAAVSDGAAIGAAGLF
jgi:hypothetical protein